MSRKGWDFDIVSYFCDLSIEKRPSLPISKVLGQYLKIVFNNNCWIFFPSLNQRLKKNWDGWLWGLVGIYYFLSLLWLIIGRTQPISKVILGQYKYWYYQAFNSSMVKNWMMGGGVPTSIFKRQIGVGRDIFSDTSWDFKNVTAIYLVLTL